jgi:hypothetical protein
MASGPTNGLKSTALLLNNSMPVIAHLTLRVQEANKLLRLLNKEQINSATLYPGYKGVVESLDEREFWDNPNERANYWLKQ